VLGLTRHLGHDAGMAAASALPTFNNLQAKISGREPKRLLIENG